VRSPPRRELNAGMSTPMACVVFILIIKLFRLSYRKRASSPPSKNAIGMAAVRRKLPAKSGQRPSLAAALSVTSSQIIHGM
jgi:hypothetical protein